MFLKKKSQRGGAPPFDPISQEPDFSQICGFHQKLANMMLYHLKAFAEKSQEQFLIKYQKGLFLGHFGPFSPFFGRTRFFLENWAPSLFSTHGPLTSCQKLEKSLERLLRSCVTDGRTDGRTCMNSQDLASGGPIGNVTSINLVIIKNEE